MSHVTLVLARAQVLLDAPPYPIGCVVSVEDMRRCVHSLGVVTETLENVIQQEPAMVRTALNELLAWAAQLEDAARAVQAAVDALWRLVTSSSEGMDLADSYRLHGDSDSDSDSTCHDDAGCYAAYGGDCGSDAGMPDLLSDSESDCGGSACDGACGSDSEDDTDMPDDLASECSDIDTPDLAGSRHLHGD
ncbi:hypothetical protein CYMTET_6096 [Cymbomonas tetramitiformis]|uniref:Uncharacterized protein n=1 Tax=Cymbomonas tetramitiformis TaxID=36881 RepID=A0AAE0GY47_9CHLO|nr:hypothetical protein CYMTET_6096 [Cymbomonas tetramitiformis]